MNNIEDIKFIEKTYEEISSQYEGCLYDKEDPYHITYQRIHNAVTILLNSAIKANNDVNTLDNLKTIMLEIKNILLTVMFPYDQDKSIRTLLARYNYNPEKLLITNPTRPPFIDF